MTVGTHIQYVPLGTTTLIEANTSASTAFNDWTNYGNNQLLALLQGGGVTDAGTVYLVDYRTGTETSLFTIPETNNFTGLPGYIAKGITFDGHHIILSMYGTFVEGANDEIWFLDFNGSLKKYFAAGGETELTNSPFRITTDGVYLYILDDLANKIYVYDYIGNRIRNFSVVAASYGGIDFNGTDLLIISTGTGGAIARYNLSGTLIKTNNVGASELAVLNCIAFNGLYQIIRIDETVPPVDIG